MKLRNVTFSKIKARNVMKINKGVYLVSKGQYMGMTQLAVKGCGMQLISVISRINKI